MIEFLLLLSFVGHVLTGYQFYRIEKELCVVRYWIGMPDDAS